MKVRRRRKRITLVQKMLLGYVLLVLIPTIFAGALFMRRSQENYERMREQDLRSALHTSAARIEHNLKFLQESTAFIQNHSSFISFLREGPYGVADQLTNYLREFGVLLNYLRHSSNYLQDVCILTDRPQIVPMSGVVRYSTDCLENLTQEDYSGFWKLQLDESGKTLLNYHCVIYTGVAGRIVPLAVYSVDCSLTLIEDSLAMSDQNVQVLLRTDSGLYRMEEDRLIPWEGEAELSCPLDMLGTELCLSAGSSWIQEQRDAQFVSLLMIVCLCVLSTGLYFSIVLGLSKRLLRFAMHISRFSVPHLYEDDSDDELGTLVSAYNSMLRNNLEMRKQVEFEQLRQREAEWLALQAQINPYFLYNTLETARMSAEIGDNRVAADILYMLGSQLHYAMTPDDGKTKIRDEVNHACKYLSTQQYRMEERLSCSISVQTEALDCSCLKFIIQPLVENAVIHGIAPRPEGGHLQVHVWMDGPWCILKVIDDGAGVSLERLRELQQLLRSDGMENTGKSIGLSNVFGRMRYIYGDGFSMKIDSPVEGGFCAEIRWREDMRRCG